MNRTETHLKAVQILVPADRTILQRRHVNKRILQPEIAVRGSRPRICICCGEPMTTRGNSLSRDPNVCASCSSLADGMEEGVENDKAIKTPDDGSDPSQARNASGRFP
jgi:formylmethanofuran dehydrogenase subunit E